MQSTHEVPISLCPKSKKNKSESGIVCGETSGSVFLFSFFYSTVVSFSFFTERVMWTTDNGKYDPEDSGRKPSLHPN